MLKVNHVSYISTIKISSIGYRVPYVFENIENYHEIYVLIANFIRH